LSAYGAPTVPGIGTTSANTVFPATATQPASTPDYAGLIASDPAYQQLQQSLNAAGVSNAAQRAAATQRALIQFGLVPDLTKLGLPGDAQNFLSQDVTPDVSALAQQNTANGLSTEARLQQAHQQNVLKLQNQLAARGALSSGEANYQLGNEQTGYAQAQQDALSQLLDAISGYQNSYLQGQQTAASQLAQGLGTAEQTQLSLPQNQPTPAESFQYNATTGKYVGANGDTYTPHAVNGGFVVVDDASGQAFALSPDGTIGSPVAYAPPAAATFNGPDQQTPVQYVASTARAAMPTLNSVLASVASSGSTGGASGAAAVKSGVAKTNTQAKRNSLL